MNKRISLTISVAVVAAAALAQSVNWPTVKPEAKPGTRWWWLGSSVDSTNLTYNLEPCYTIILAFLIFGEGREINFSFYLGIALILLSVLLQSMKAWRH